MHRQWLFASAFVGAVALIALAGLGSNLGSYHVGTRPRLVALAMGLLVLLVVLLATGVIRTGARVALYLATFSRLLARLGLLFPCVLVAVLYIYFVSVGTWWPWPPTMDYYDRLATAFTVGHLDLKDAPDPALLALPNPYDPEARDGIPGLGVEQPGTLWDMSLYNGRIYPYWGPAPALLLAGAKLIQPIHIGDQALTFAFLLGAFIFEALLIYRLWRRFFRDTPAWTVSAGFLLAGLANPVPWLLFSPRVYEAAIAAGQCFFVAGLYFSFCALDRPRVSGWLLALAAVAWVAAAASRAPLTVVVAFMGLILVVAIVFDHSESSAQRLRHLAAFAVPLVLGAVLLAWYNLARFGSIFEFGFRYAITMLDQNKYHSILFSPAYLRENAYLYLFNAPSLNSLFPFIRPLWNEASITLFKSRGNGIYNSEPMIGLVYAAPFLLYGLLAPLLAVVRSERSTAPQADMQAPSAASQAFIRSFTLVLSGLAVLELLLVFLVYYSSMRYFMDATPTLLLLALIGFWAGYRRLRGHILLRDAYVVTGLLLVVTTIIIGILVGFSSNLHRIRTFNQPMLNHLRLLFIVIARSLGL